MLLNALVSAGLQVVLLLLLPFVWWLVRGRQEHGFLAWLGWKRPEASRPGRLALGMSLAFVLFLGLGLLLVARVPAELAADRFTGRGWVALPEVLLFALVQTAFAEESLFRGFLLKRLAGRYGLPVGNLLQAVAFGLLHAVPLTVLAGPGWGLAGGIGMVGLVAGYLNEQEERSTTTTAPSVSQGSSVRASGSSMAASSVSGRS